jgi:hypothetical protein
MAITRQPRRFGQLQSEYSHQSRADNRYHFSYYRLTLPETLERDSSNGTQ